MPEGHGSSPTPLPNASAARAFCAVAALAAVPLAWAAAWAGYGVPTSHPARDLALLVVVSIAEEIVFRGGLQPMLAGALPHRVLLGVTPSNATTSAVFAALHLWRHPPEAAAAIFFVSLVFGRARELSGRVVPAAALHVGFNLLLYAASWLRAVP